MVPDNYESSSVISVKLQDAKLIYRNLLHFQIKKMTYHLTSAIIAIIINNKCCRGGGENVTVLHCW